MPTQTQTAHNPALGTSSAAIREQLCLVVLGVGYYLIWRSDLWRNRDLVAIGALYKFAYTGVGVYIAITDEVPHALFLWGFGVADGVFLVLMAECLWYLYQHRPASEVVMQEIESTSH